MSIPEIKVLSRRTPCILNCSRHLPPSFKVTGFTDVITKEVPVSNLSRSYINKGKYIVIVNDPDSISDIYLLKVNISEDPVILVAGSVTMSVKLVNQVGVDPESIVGNADLFADSLVSLISDHCISTSDLKIFDSTNATRIIPIRVLLLDSYMAHHVLVSEDCIWKNMRYYGDTRLGYKWWNSLGGKSPAEKGFEKSHTRFLLQVMGITNSITRMLQESIWDRANTILMDNGI